MNYQKAKSVTSDEPNRHAVGEPTLEWFRIQDDIMNADADILLFLDCCFAAQAGRERVRRPGRVELLAAAAMGMKTPLPGERSFTRALIKEIRSFMQRDFSVTIADLHRRLVAREANLLATPVYITLVPRQRTMRLLPLPEILDPSVNEDIEGPYIQLLFRTIDQLDKSHIDEIVQWLGADTPQTVTTLRVQKIFQTTAKIQSFVQNVHQVDQPLAKTLDEPAYEDIMKAWESVSALIEQHNTQQKRASRMQENMVILQQRVRRFLEQLEAENSSFIDTVERSVLNSTRLTNPTALSEAIHDPVTEMLGIADQLRLRQLVCSSGASGMPQSDSEAASSADFATMQEYKKYGRYVDPAEMPDLTARVALLAELLSATKSPDFLSLRCCRWYHERLEHRFVLDFEIPPLYGAKLGAYQSLQSIILDSKGSVRPSLNNRLRIAFLLAKAVQKWHSVGWVHQGISSPNVIFLSFNDGNKIDYSSPFLQGFEFARPKSDPSIGRSDDDVAFKVYRHPNRQGPGRRGHTKVHDLYSLGVVLLEIGLWQSAFDIVNRGRKETITPTSMLQKLQGACSERLAHYAGSSYQTAVGVCLSSRFDVDLDDQNESRLAISFQKRVVDELGKGVMMN
jgi:hypothetical protein